MLFREIYGHAGIRERLIKTTRENRVSHAIMLYGPEGSGKFALALAYAQFLQCSGEKDGDSCGACPSCQQAAKMIHPDIHFVFPVVKGKQISSEDKGNSKGSSDPISDNFVKQWRSFIAESAYPTLQSWLQYLEVENKQGSIFKHEAEVILRKLSLKAFESDFKVVLIWLPEKMNPTAANKLLKVIEEPPEKTVFILVAEQTDTILPTILSRTQLIRVPKLTDDELADSLRHLFPESSADIEDIVLLADGNLVKAQDLLFTNDQTRFYQEEFIHWLRMSYKFKVGDILEWIPAIVNIGRE
ncbi:MAG: DNA polymerase III subunit delta, partial [Bacteroidales bacterium]|nr:DNA polymerase III subunit delta [Bacteroidales bacterium]